MGKRIYVESTHVTEILIKHLDIGNQQPKFFSRRYYGGCSLCVVKLTSLDQCVIA